MRKPIIDTIVNVDTAFRNLKAASSFSKSKNPPREAGGFEGYSQLINQVLLPPEPPEPNRFLIVLKTTGISCQKMKKKITILSAEVITAVALAPNIEATNTPIIDITSANIATVSTRLFASSYRLVIASSSLENSGVEAANTRLRLKTMAIRHISDIINIEALRVNGRLTAILRVLKSLLAPAKYFFAKQMILSNVYSSLIIQIN
jgi:hypothetical protein